MKCINCRSDDVENLHEIFDGIYYCTECARRYGLQIPVRQSFINDNWEVI